MIKSRVGYYPELRKDFDNATEIAEIINRSIATVWNKLSGKSEFTYREMVMLAKATGRNESEARSYCRKEA